MRARTTSRDALTFSFFSSAGVVLYSQMKLTTSWGLMTFHKPSDARTRNFWQVGSRGCMSTSGCGETTNFCARSHQDQKSPRDRDTLRNGMRSTVGGLSGRLHFFMLCHMQREPRSIWKEYNGVRQRSMPSFVYEGLTQIAHH